MAAGLLMFSSSSLAEGLLEDEYPEPDCAEPRAPLEAANDYARRQLALANAEYFGCLHRYLDAVRSDASLLRRRYEAAKTLIQNAELKGINDAGGN